MSKRDKGIGQALEKTWVGIVLTSMVFQIGMMVLGK